MIGPVFGAGRTLTGMTQWGLDVLFNPAKRHMDEEKRRLQSTREEIGDSSGGKRIDLESGKVVIERDDEAGHAAESEADNGEQSASARSEQARRPKKTGKKGKTAAVGETSSKSAAERSAERHRRVREQAAAPSRRKSSAGSADATSADTSD